MIMCARNYDLTSSELSSISKHRLRKYIDEHLDIYQEYADYIHAITTDENKIDHIKKTAQN